MRLPHIYRLFERMVLFCSPTRAVSSTAGISSFSHLTEEGFQETSMDKEPKLLPLKCDLLERVTWDESRRP